MAKVYHGTTESAKKGILANGFISVTTDDNKRYLTTHTGSVYVTKDFYQAIDFSTRPKVGMRNYPVIIFEIEIDESELLPDSDEKKWKSTLDSNNGYKNCYKIKRNLQIGTDVKRMYYKYFKTSNEAGKFMQDVQYKNIVINDNAIEWETLVCQD